jgi:iodotyrosine deiodinase
VVSDVDLKARIRREAEAREREFYGGLAGDEWLDALSPLGTNWSKPFLTEAPHLICVFAQRYGVDEDGHQIKHYYVHESVGIAVGLLIAAVHRAGLGSLTYTPTKPAFLNELLERPDNERPYLILAAGHPADDAIVPHHDRKALGEITTFC